MPSLRKRVTSYFRQLSFHNEPRERRLNINENSFITKYLQGQIRLKDGPTVISGKNPADLPSYDLDAYAMGSDAVVGCYTGPCGGLTTVKRTEKHLSVADPDIDFIDTQITTQEETVSGSTDSTDSSGRSSDFHLPEEWGAKSDYIYGLSDSLYDRNQVTKIKNGDPIADCFGIIARKDSSAILAVADGVNWGEKACIAAKSAIHGCLHYLSRTIFNDTKPFDNLKGTAKCETPLHNSRVTNTREVFVCLLRAFNCAHDLILENNGMLTTLTVAIVLPLKNSVSGADIDATAQKYICCVCNVGDTLAYVYSQRHGVRELTKGSHDVHCNRDMRDALGALGPVDGINPELSNLTLSLTTLQKGDIVFVASDGLTDNFDPNVCKFTVNSGLAAVKKSSSTAATTHQRPAAQQQQQQQRRNTTKPEERNKTTPVKPPRKHQQSKTRPPQKLVDDISKTIDEMTKIVNRDPTVADHNNPLVAQFVRDNSIDATDSYAKCRQSLNNKPSQPNFSRSKTSIDLRPKTISRNEDGLPYVSPIQRYELTLLLMEDVLRHGISGRESGCLNARQLCENLMNFTFSITAAKRHTLEDNDLYFDNQNGVLVEVSAQEKKARRKKGLERVQNLPGKLDHVTVVAFNV